MKSSFVLKTANRDRSKLSATKPQGTPVKAGAKTGTKGSLDTWFSSNKKR